MSPRSDSASQGSDDRSDLWINDQSVWGSSSELKAWRLAEDFRRVHFRKGRNKLLMRIENGPQDCGWSVCIATEEGGLVAVMHAIRSTSPIVQMGYGLISPRYDRIILQ